MSEDTEALEKQLDKKQYGISDLKAIHKVQGELTRNMRNEQH